jgi:hypothetical protein
MTLEAVYYVTQIIAVGAILASLVAIWFQMRQSAKMERAAAQREVLERVSQFARGLSGEASDHFLLGLNDFEAASGKTRIETELHLFEFAFVTESALNMHRDGFFSEGTWAGIEGVMLGLIRTPGGAIWWRHAQHMLGFEIAQYLNRRLAQIDPKTPNYLDFSPSYRLRLSELIAAS